MGLIIGDAAPEFDLPDENGKQHSLKDYSGKNVVLFFYPADDTPGCTKEACNFRDDFSKYEEAGAILLGISPDDSKSHLAFKEKYQLPFTLLADKDHKVSGKYGAWGPKKLFGHKYEGIVRTSFLIDSSGKIADIFSVTRIGRHSEDVLSAIEKLNI